MRRFQIYLFLLIFLLLTGCNPTSKTRRYSKYYHVLEKGAASCRIAFDETITGEEGRWEFRIGFSSKSIYDKVRFEDIIITDGITTIHKKVSVEITSPHYIQFDDTYSYDYEYEHNFLEKDYDVKWKVLIEEEGEVYRYDLSHTLEFEKFTTLKWTR